LYIWAAIFWASVLFALGLPPPAVDGLEFPDDPDDPEPLPVLDDPNE
jgi:hypothetical protein